MWDRGCPGAGAGPANSSERAHLHDMLGELPAHALITADAGFVGYEVCARCSRPGITC